VKEWLDDDRNVFLGEELLHNKPCMAQHVTMIQKPLPLPLVMLLPPNCITQPLKNLPIEMTILPREYELTVHQTTVDVKEFRELFGCIL
jgi:hypothetical protein